MENCEIFSQLFLKGDKGGILSSLFRQRERERKSLKVSTTWEEEYYIYKKKKRKKEARHWISYVKDWSNRN
jgi:tRNA(Ile)-lysidine synthase TilS/MesJ